MEEEVAGDWRRLQNEERHNLYTSPNVIRVIKSRKMRWWTMEKVRNAKGRDDAKSLGVNEKIILEWILDKWGGKVWTGLI
jgi:hypothetical protein